MLERNENFNTICVKIFVMLRTFLRIESQKVFFVDSHIVFAVWTRCKINARVRTDGRDARRRR